MGFVLTGSTVGHDGRAHYSRTIVDRWALDGFPLKVVQEILGHRMDMIESDLNRETALGRGPITWRVQAWEYAG